MCWNKDISLNTFIFACLALLFIYFTNTYSKYKLHAFDNPLVYVFLFQVSIMQLIEYFLWKNLKDKSLNEYLSRIAHFFVTTQPITVMLMIENITIKYSLLFIYIIFLITYTVFKYNYSPTILQTSIGKNGHLQWEWINSNGYGNKVLLIIYLLIYVIAFLLINNKEISVIGLLTLFISLFFYYKDNTFGSMWCWLYNVFMLYFIVNILLIQPFYEYNSLC